MYGTRTGGRMTGPKLGVGVFIEQRGEILLGKRLNAHGAGEWSLPGGHVETGEDYYETVRREVLEEVGLVIHPTALIEQVGFSQDFFIENDSHYVTIYFFVKLRDCDGTVQNLEPDKKESWEWFSREDFPSREETFCNTYDLYMKNKWIWEG
jgi:8-oxo-dGTP diphosphatase